MESLLQYLSKCAIPYQRLDHPPVYTCDEARKFLAGAPGIGTKNLFLRDRNGARYFLLVTSENRRVDLKQLGERIGVKGLGFGSERNLKEILGLEPGAVSVLALVNDRARCVRVLIDREIWGNEPLHCHPLINTSTLVIEPSHLAQFLEGTGHVPELIDVPARPDGA